MILGCFKRLPLVSEEEDSLMLTSITTADEGKLRIIVCPPSPPSI